MVARYLPRAPFPDWARTDGYPEGPDPWGAGPTKIEPAAGLRDAGQVPNTQLAAQHYNWLNFRYGEMLGVLAHIPMQTWQMFQPGDSLDPTEDNTVGKVVCGYSFDTFNYGRSNRQIIAAFGSMVVSSSDFSAFFSTYGHRWDSTSALPNTVIDANGDSGKLFLSVGGSRDLTYATNIFNIVNTSANVAPAGANLHLLHWSPFSGGRLFMTSHHPGNPGVTGQVIFYTDGAVTTINPAAVPAQYRFVNSMADNGAGTLVATTFSPQHVIVSTDHGATWTFVDNVFVGSEVVYSSVYDQFVVVCPNGQIRYSQDGTHWTSVTSQQRFILESLGSVTPHQVACIGGVLCAIANEPYTNTDTRSFRGVAYSFNLGETWHMMPFADINDPSHAPIMVRAINGRFVVGAPRRIYVSGPVWSPDPDISLL